MTTGKTTALTIWTFVGKTMSLLFNTLSRFVIPFLSLSIRSNHLISWLQSPSAMILEPKKKSVTAFTFSISICQEVMGPEATGFFLFVLILSFKMTFSLSFFTLIKRFFSFSSLPIIKVLSSACLRLLFLQLVTHIQASIFMTCSVYRSNKQGDIRQSCHTPFSILNQSVVPCRTLTAVS